MGPIANTPKNNQNNFPIYQVVGLCLIIVGLFTVLNISLFSFFTFLLSPINAIMYVGVLVVAIKLLNEIYKSQNFKISKYGLVVLPILLFTSYFFVNNLLVKWKIFSMFDSLLLKTGAVPFDVIRIFLLYLLTYWFLLWFFSNQGQNNSSNSIWKYFSNAADAIITIITVPVFMVSLILNIGW